MIVTLTVNPAIDRNITVDRLAFEDRARILARTDTAGGRGVMASRLIKSFGGSTLAIVTSGGKTGKKLERLLEQDAFPVEIFRIRREVRMNFTITDQRGLTVQLNERGPELEASEQEGLEQLVLEKIQGAKWLLLCGSLPPGVPGRFYANLIRKARERGVDVLLDTDGEALVVGIEARPTVVTPNQQEAERLLDTVLLTRRQFLEAAHRIRQMGSESVVLTLGSRGAIGVDENHELEAVPPRVDVVCPIGAGDALSAAFAWARTQGYDFPEALRWGVAAGTASAMLPGLQVASLEQTQRIYEKVEVRPVEFA